MEGVEGMEGMEDVGSMALSLFPWLSPCVHGSLPVSMTPSMCTWLPPCVHDFLHMCIIPSRKWESSWDLPKQLDSMS